MNKLGTKLGAIAMSAVMALSFAPSAAITSLAAGGDDLTDATQELSTPVYRLYNPNSGEHLFTTNENECDSLDKNGWDYETIAWYAPSTGDPVFRLYNPNHPLGDHHYTSSEEERDNLIKQGWKLDATAFNTVAEGELLGAPVYSLYNPNAYDLGMATHHLTLSEEEADGLELLGWTNEGPKFYEYAEDLDPEVEELTVSIDNTTPKVGDTIRVLIYDEDGNEVNPDDVDAEIQWYADSIEITDADEAEYDVIVGDVGVKLSACVTIDGEEYWTDQTAKVEEAGDLVDADQIGEYTVEVTFSDAAPEGEFEVTKGESKAAVAVADVDFDDERTSAILTFESKLQDADYTITFVPDVGEESSVVRTFAKAHLAEITFPTGVAVAQSLNDIKKVKVNVVGLDQFGSEIAIPTAGTQFTFSKGLSIGTANPVEPTTISSFKDGVLTIAAAPTQDSDTDGTADAYQSGDYFQLGGLAPLVVTATYSDGEGHVASGSAQLQISNQSVVQEIVWGELTTDNEGYKDKPVTHKSLLNANYYVPFTAVDQYDLDVSAEAMEALRNNASPMLFVTPDSSTKSGFAAYAGKGDAAGGPTNTETVFGVKTINGVDTNVMYIGAGTSPIRSGEVEFSIIPAGASTQKWTLDVEPDPDIDELTIEKIAYQEGVATDFVIEATDNYGDDVDFYDYAPVVANTGTGTTLTWKQDANALYETKVTVTGATVEMKKDANTKTVSFITKPMGLKNTVVSVVWTTAGQKTGSWTSTVQAPRSLEQINTDNVYLYMLPGTTLNLTTDGIDSTAPISFVDSNGNKIKAKNTAANAVTSFGAGEKLTGKFSAYTWSVTPTSTNAVWNGAATTYDPGNAQWETNNTDNAAYDWNGFTLSGDGKVIADATNTNGTEITTPKSDSVTVHLYKLTTSDVTGTNNAVKVEEVAKKNITITVVPENAVDYTLSVTNKLYTGKAFAAGGADIDASHYAAVEVSGTYNGYPVYTGTKKMVLESVSVDVPGVKYSENIDAVSVYEGANDITGATKTGLYTETAYDKEGTGTISGTIVVGSETQDVSAEFEYSNETPIGTAATVASGTTYDEIVTGIDLDKTAQTVTAWNINAAGIGIIDQYGQMVEFTPVVTGYTHVNANGEKTVVDLSDADHELVAAPGAVTFNGTDKTLVLALGAEAADANHTDGEYIQTKDSFTVICASGAVSAKYEVVFGSTATALANSALNAEYNIGVRADIQDAEAAVGGTPSVTNWNVGGKFAIDWVP